MSEINRSYIKWRMNKYILILILILIFILIITLIITLILFSISISISIYLFQVMYAHIDNIPFTFVAKHYGME